MLGFSDSPSSIAQLSITKKELTVSGSRLQSDKFPEVIEWINSGKIKTSSFVSHRFAMEDIQQAIQLIETNPDAVRKVILEVGGASKRMVFQWYEEGNDPIPMCHIKQIPGVKGIVWAWKG